MLNDNDARKREAIKKKRTERKYVHRCLPCGADNHANCSLHRAAAAKRKEEKEKAQADKALAIANDDSASAAGDEPVDRAGGLSAADLKENVASNLDSAVRKSLPKLKLADHSG